MGRPPQPSGVPVFRFLPQEVAEMERVLDENNGISLPRQGCESLADAFTNAPERLGHLPIQWKQVWNWFQNRRHSQKAKMGKIQQQQQQDGVAKAPIASPLMRMPASPVVPAMPPYVQHHHGVPDEEKDMEFEAKSSRDGAWYDVSMFLSHRDEGEPEVRVRFAGFGSEEDEWVDVKTSVRQRSVPCEMYECVVVLKGDLILCFQEGHEQALYYDASVLDIQRRRHDHRGCRCRFWVRYLHDLSEEVVPLKKICRRPESDLRVQRNGKVGI